MAAARAGPFRFRPDPVKMTQLAAGALSSCGGCAAARRTVERSYTREQVFESLRLPRSERPTSRRASRFPSRSSTACASVASTAAQTAAFPPCIAADEIASDTGELSWQPEPGLVTVATERSQSLVGVINGKSIRHLAAEVANPFCALTLSSLDGKPISRSAKMLLSASARAANTGMQWNAKRTSLTDWGAAPTVIEPVTGTVTLRNLDGAREVRATALDSGGRPLGPEIAAKKTPAGWTLEIGKPITTWYAVAVKR